MSPTNHSDGAGSAGQANVERAILGFLRSLEAAQQSILFQNIREAQTRLHREVGDSLADARAPAAQGSGPVFELLREVLTLLDSAYDMFCAERTWPDYAMAYLSSRTQQVRALERLYSARADLPIVEAYFRLDDTDPIMEPTEPGAATGIMHHDDPAAGGQYSLYVPERYDPATRWPMVVCLHGSHGRGDEYLWTWLRAARSHGAVVLSPKSGGLTWSIMQPAIDRDAILTMIERTCSDYAIDPDRILLTGLSDGGTFAYLLGLGQPGRFSACAPIAGVLSPSAEHLLRAQTGRELPLHVVHGALDAIFAVQNIRRTQTLLESAGYAITYTELPDWGHALTTAINETVVWPWFEALGG